MTRRTLRFSIAIGFWLLLVLVSTVEDALVNPTQTQAAGEQVVLGNTREEPDELGVQPDQKFVWGGYLLSSDSAVTAIWVRVRIVTAGTPTRVRGVVYEDDGTGKPGPLRITSAEVTVGNKPFSWIRFPVSPSVTLSGGRKYHIGVQNSPDAQLRTSNSTQDDATAAGIKASGGDDSYADGPSDPFGPLIGAQIDKMGSAYLVGPSGPIKPATDHLGGPGDNPHTAFSPDPANLGTGNFFHQHTDLFLPGRGPELAFTRAHNSLAGSTGPLGFGWSFNYGMHLDIDRSDPSMTKVKRVGEAGNGATFVERPDGSYAAPPGVFETLVENQDGSFQLTRRNQVKFNFSSTGRLQSIVDRSANSVTLTYSGADLDLVTGSGGRTLDFETSQGRITRVTDPQGSRYVEFSYDANGDLSQVRDVKGGLTIFSYQNHRLKTIKDANGNIVTDNTFDGNGRLVEQVDGLGNRTCIYFGTPPLLNSLACPTISPAPAANQTVLVNPGLSRTTYTFDADFATTASKDALGNTTSFSYEAAGALCSPNTNGNLCSVTDPLGHKTSFTYDNNGNMLFRTNALNKTWTFTYTSRNDIATERDPLGQKTEYGYDAAGNLTSITRKDASGAQAAPPTTLGRAPSGNGDLISVTDGNGHTTSFTYDGRGLLDTVTDALNHTTNYGFDSAGRLLCIVDAEGNQTKFEYDAQNNIRFVHDAENTQFQAGTCTIAGADARTEYQYDAKGNRRFVINARGKQTEFRYYETDRLKEVIDPKGRRTSFTYDPNGNLKTRTDPRPWTITYEYDQLDRLTAIEYPDSHLNTSFTYYADGLRQTMTDSTGTTSYAYFADHALQTVTHPQHPQNNVISYQYDDAGNRKKVIYPDATKDVDYTYDAFNRMKTVTDWLGNVTTYSYDPGGNLDLATTNLAGAPDDLITDWQFDNADRLDLLTNKRGTTTLSSYDYTVDNVGNRTQVINNGSGTNTYGYDDLYRLGDVTYPDSDTQTYDYDPVGNRLKLVENGSPTSYEYDGADQLTRECLGTQSCIDSTPGTEYGYAGNGSLVYFGPSTGPTDHPTDPVDTDNQFPLQDYEGRYLRIGHCYEQFPPDETVDLFNDIFGVAGAFGFAEGAPEYSVRNDVRGPGYMPDGTVDLFYDIFGVAAQFGHECADNGQFVYNGDGLRVQRWAGATKTDYVWDVGAALPVVLQEATGSQTTYYVYGLDLISSVQGTAPTFYLYDGLGSTRGLANGSGSVTDTYEYDVFGATRSQTGSSSQAFKFTGELEDGTVANDLYYLRARYYDPGLGRFWTKDPFFGFAPSPMSQNRYAYVSNRPVHLEDPWGLCGVSSFGDVGDCFEEAVEPIEDAAGAVTGVVIEGPVWPWLSNGVQILDLVPFGAVPVFGQAVGTVFDVLAFVAAEIDILRSSCEAKVGLTLANVGNLGQGLLGNLLTTAPNVLISGNEALIYGATTGALASCGKE